MNDRSWQMDFGRLAVLLLPTFLRKPVIGKYTRLMISGVSYLHMQLVTYRDETAYELSLSGQVCRLRGLLNDVFDRELRRLTVVDVKIKPSGVIVWQRELLTGLLIGNRTNKSGLTVSCRGYEGVKQPDFEIVVPAGLDIDYRKMAALINAHKLAGKRYVITKLI